MRIPYRKTARGIVIEVKVHPRASRAEVTGVLGEALKVSLTAPPVEGEANRQLVELLARELGVKKAQVEIVRGAGSRTKAVLVRGVEALPSGE